MIDKISYEIVKAVAAGINFDDKWAGLTKPMRKQVASAEKIFPVAINTPTTCDQSDYTALVPDSTKKSVMFIEKIGNPVVDIYRTNYKHISQTIRLVVWYNLDLITEGKYISEDVLTDQVLDHLPKRLSDSLFDGAKQVHILPTGIIYGTEIFNAYTFNEIKTQFGIFPYGVFAVDLDVWYIQTHCQDKLDIGEGCMSGVGNHENYVEPV